MVLNNHEEYFHAELKVDQNGLVTFEPLSYRANPYPSTPLFFDEVYEHAAEDKMWMIVKGTNGDHVMYQNNVTNGRYVYQFVKTNPSMQQRISEKLAKGYVKTKPMQFFANTRRLIIS